MIEIKLNWCRDQQTSSSVSSIRPESSGSVGEEDEVVAAIVDGIFDGGLRSFSIAAAEHFWFFVDYGGVKNMRSESINN